MITIIEFRTFSEVLKETQIFTSHFHSPQPEGSMAIMDLLSVSIDLLLLDISYK